MDIIHRIGFNTNRNQSLKELVERLSIDYQTQKLIGNDYLIYFDISESDHNWERIKEHLQDVSDVVFTKFSNDEILASEWARLIPNYEQGYPEPQKSWPDLHQNYQMVCKNCGTFKQISSFMISSEPKMRGRHFVSLFWTNALFASQEVIASFEDLSIRGIEYVDLYVKSKTEISNSVKQIKILTFTEPGYLNLRGEPKTCLECKNKKYLPHIRGPITFKSSAFQTVHANDFVESYEWFGDGKNAFREIFISNRLASIILKNKWNGISLQPIQLV